MKAKLRPRHYATLVMVASWVVNAIRDGLPDGGSPLASWPFYTVGMVVAATACILFLCSIGLQLKNKTEKASLCLAAGYGLVGVYVLAGAGLAIVAGLPFGFHLLVAALFGAVALYLILFR